MTIPGIWRRLNAPIDGWFTAPETHAAGRIGLYRIIFSAFYLWHLSSHFAANLSGLPDDQRSQVLLVGWIERSCLSPLIFQLLESSLVAALVILMIGYRVPLATAAVLILGCLYESFFVSFSGERATTLLMFYIPLFALLAGRWGATYSLDAFIQRRTGGAATEPEDSSWCYFVPARAVLVVLAALFFSSGVLKVAFGANWLTIPGRFANIMLEANIKSAIGELPLNPLAPALAQMPTFVDIARYLIVLFESMFFLALFSRKLRNFFLSLALIFHSANALWFVVTFTPILIVYGLFVDWQALRERLWPGRVTLLDSIALAPTDLRGTELGRGGRYSLERRHRTAHRHQSGRRAELAHDLVSDFTAVAGLVHARLHGPCPSDQQDPGGSPFPADDLACSFRTIVKGHSVAGTRLRPRVAAGRPIGPRRR